MWVMQQLGRRAGTLDVDLKSHRHRLGEMMLLSSSALELDVRDAAMFEGRAAQVDLNSLFSTGEARGTNLSLWVCWFVVRNVAAAVGTKFCFKLCCLIVGEMFFPVHPAERFVLNGKVKVMLTTVCSAIDELL